jgi:hypothetical protein
MRCARKEGVRLCSARFLSRLVRNRMKDATLAGRRCHHLEISRADGWQQDLFILIENDINYSLLVMQRTRDRSFVETAKKAFRFTSK